MTTDPARYSTPTTPKGTGPEGRRWLRALTAGGWEFRPDELRLVPEAARLLDELALMNARITTDGLMVEGSTGQLRAHPLLAEVRGSRQVLVRIISQLGLPDDEQETTRTPNQVRASKAAQARWARARGEA